MIISHRHKFIYVNNRKLAGTSEEKALAEICGPEDILTHDHIHRSEAGVLLAQA